MSYFISTFENGQPFILYNEQSYIYLYIIQSGRIISRGLIIDDVKSYFTMHKITYESKQYISYLSNDNSIKLLTLDNQHFTQVVSIPTEAFNGYPIEYFAFTLCGDTLVLLYCQKNADNSTSLYYINAFSPLVSTRLLSNIKSISAFEVIHNNTSTKILITCSKLFVWKLNIDFSVELLQTYDSLSYSKIKNLKNTIAKQAEEISKLHQTNQYISSQYNELADYARDLQNELRKLQLFS